MWIYDGRGNAAKIDFVYNTPPGVYCKPPEKVRKVVYVQQSRRCGEKIGYRNPESAANLPEWAKDILMWAKTAPVSPCGCSC